MNSIKKTDIIFEVKSMGLSFYLPIILLITLSFMNFSGDGYEFIRRLSLFIEFIICPLASWWCIYLFIDYYEENIEELLFTYPVKFFFHGVFRSLTFLIIYISLVIISIIPISIRHEEVLWNILVIQFIPQCLLYGAIGFCLMVLTRNIVTPILFIMGYVAGKYFTGGSDLLPIYNIMFFGMETSYQLLIQKATINICLTLILFLVGHLVMKKLHKFLKRGM